MYDVEHLQQHSYLIHAFIVISHIVIGICQRTKAENKRKHEREDIAHHEDDQPHRKNDNNALVEGVYPGEKVKSGGGVFNRKMDVEESMRPSEEQQYITNEPEGQDSN